jgi:hypothetical protein
MYEIYNELYTSINTLESDVLQINNTIHTNKNNIDHYSSIINIKDFDCGDYTSDINVVNFQYPSFIIDLKPSYRQLLEIYNKASKQRKGVCNKIAHIDDLNMIKLELRHNASSLLNSIIIKNKPHKNELRILQNEYHNIQSIISSLRNNIKSLRTIHIKKLIESNQSLGYEKLRSLYSFLEDNGSKLTVETPLYLDSYTIKELLNQLVSLTADMKSINTKIQALNIQRIISDQTLTPKDLDGDTRGDLISRIVILSSRKSFEIFESIIWTHFCKHMTFSITDWNNENEALELNKNQLMTKICELKVKLEKIKYNPEVRRMIAYENKLSLTTSSTNPGSSTR